MVKGYRQRRILLGCNTLIITRLVFTESPHFTQMEP